MNTRFQTQLAKCAILFIVNVTTVFADHSAFQVGSLQQIERQYAGEPFILVLWEVNCFPCHEELETLGKLRQVNPDMNLVLVGTDPLSKQQEVAEILDKHGLSEIDSWLFAEPNIERLRYSIDPEWYGELPRNYFYDSDSSRVGFSGKLTEEIIAEWLLFPAENID